MFPFAGLETREGAGTGADDGFFPQSEARVEGEVGLGRTVRSRPLRYGGGMSTSGDAEGLRTRITRQGEESLGRLAQDLLENPLVHGAIARAFEAREKAVQAQEVAMGALNIPSAADLERLTRRLRSVAQRLEGIEDGVDRLDARLAAIANTADLESRLGSIEESVTA